MISENLPLLSIVMVAYNSTNYIDDSIKSIINQDEDNYELIILLIESSI